MLASDIDDRSDEGESPWPAFADLLAATTLLFLVLFAVVALPALVEAGHARSQGLLLDEVEMGLVAVAKKNRVTVKRENGYLLLRIAGDATFPYQGFELRELSVEGQQILSDFAAAIRENTQLLSKIDQIQVVGHTSTEGTPDFNRMLSAKRAVSVSTFLIQQGLSACQVTALGRGPHYPLNPGSPGMKNANDRRIELEIHPIVPSDTAGKGVSRCFARRDTFPR